MKAFSLVLFAAMVAYVSCLSGGPPPAACDPLSPSAAAFPGGHGAGPQDGPSPYCVDTRLLQNDDDTFSYIPGCTYTLSFLGCTAGDPATPNSMPYRGFFVQSRSYVDNTTRLGTFGVSDDLTRLSQCLRPEDGITHNSAVGKTSVSFDWTAPDAGTGPIEFRFAVVYNRTIYWADQIELPPIMEGSSAPALTVALSAMLLSLALALSSIF